jgi:hypothetical protein
MLVPLLHHRFTTYSLYPFHLTQHSHHLLPRHITQANKGRLFPSVATKRAVSAVSLVRRRWTTISRPRLYRSVLEMCSSVKRQVRGRMSNWFSLELYIIKQPLNMMKSSGHPRVAPKNCMSHDQNFTSDVGDRSSHNLRAREHQNFRTSLLPLPQGLHLFKPAHFYPWVVSLVCGHRLILEAQFLVWNGWR